MLNVLTHWSLLIGEECGMVAAIHVGHTYVITVGPVQLPDEGTDRQCKR